MRRRIWPILVAGGIGCACLLALGLWQIERLHWKEGLIAAREAKLAAPAIPLDAAMKDAEGDASIEFLKVAATGQFRNDRELYYLTTSGGSPGFEVVTPLVTSDGATVLVDRGFVPEEKRDAGRRPDSQPSGDVTVTGYAARHERGGDLHARQQCGREYLVLVGYTGDARHGGRAARRSRGAVHSARAAARQCIIADARSARCEPPQ